MRKRKDMTVYKQTIKVIKKDTVEARAAEAARRAAAASAPPRSMESAVGSWVSDRRDTEIAERAYSDRKLHSWKVI
jgi:hypothetical protein